MEKGASVPEASTLLLRLMMTHFDRVDTGKGYTKLHTFEECKCTPFCNSQRENHVLVSTGRGANEFGSGDISGFVFGFGGGSIAGNEQFPTLMLMLYPGMDQGYGRGGTPIFTGVFELLTRVALYPTDEDGLGTCFGAA